MTDTKKVYDPEGFLSAGFLSERQLSRRCHDDIKEGDVTPISLQYQNVHWEITANRL